MDNTKQQNCLFIVAFCLFVYNNLHSRSTFKKWNHRSPQLPQNDALTYIYAIVVMGPLEFSGKFRYFVCRNPSLLSHRRQPLLYGEVLLCMRWVGVTIKQQSLAYWIVKMLLNTPVTSGHFSYKTVVLFLIKGDNCTMKVQFSYLKVVQQDKTTFQSLK